MGMEYILEDRLQHDKQNMFSAELRERPVRKVFFVTTLSWDETNNVQFKLLGATFIAAHS